VLHAVQFTEHVFALLLFVASLVALLVSRNRAEHQEAGEGWLCDPQAHNHPLPRQGKAPGRGQGKGPPHWLW
jgi:hypothetical protein